MELHAPVLNPVVNPLHFQQLAPALASACIKVNAARGWVLDV
jgi:hypothetical protein